MSQKREVEVGDKLIQFEFNKFAKQAASAVMVSCGDTQVLVTVCASDEPKEGQDFFPLTVDYFEKFYSAGRIPGGFIKRESKPSDRETLIARVIDRPLRPCFPDGYLCETFVTATVLSFDPKHHPAPLALIGASTALMISDIPFNGPVAALSLGMKDGDFILDPDELTEDPVLQLNLAAKPGAILMVEAGAKFLAEEQMLNAIDYSYNLMTPLFDMQLEVQKEFGKPKRPLIIKDLDKDIKTQIESLITDNIKNAFSIKDKKSRNNALSEIYKEVQEKFNQDSDADLKVKLNNYVEHLNSNYVRGLILNEEKRIDGRSLTEIRPISCEVGVLKRPHGSALFTRGETQSLATVTLGAAEDEQKLDSVLSPDNSKKFMLHYNFPPFSVGEARHNRGPGRREIGHGALAERALSTVIPPASKFGYTIRLVSEILESNGSSSMASVCAGTMALLNAGVPIQEPVAGIAMGLIKGENDKFAILTDILGDEDHLGDMDFKVCGGASGITALQMDIKVDGLSRDILARALEQAKQGRDFILGKLTEAISEPSKLSEFAPRIFNLKIKTDKIKDLIGPGGKNIKKITADTGVKIDISDDGMLAIVSPDTTSAEAAKKLIRNLTTDPEIGEIYLGTVRRVMDFGVFVEIKPGIDGLCHISQLEEKRVDNIFDHYHEGMEMLVKVVEIDSTGRLKLSRKDALGKKPTLK